MSKLNLIVVIAITSVILVSVVASLPITSHISNAFAQVMQVATLVRPVEI